MRPSQSSAQQTFEARQTSGLLGVLLALLALFLVLAPLHEARIDLDGLIDQLANAGRFLTNQNEANNFFY